MSALTDLLHSFRQAAETEREKGTYFEDLILNYLKQEASYRDLYSDVWTYADWAEQQGLDRRDAGIDLVAQTNGTQEFHAIQCKFYDADYKIQKADIDSFFTASGKKSFSHRLIVATTSHWSDHAKAALQNQQPPVSKIDLLDLEASQIDWSRYQPGQAVVLKPKKQPRPHQERALERVSKGLAVADRGKLIMACGTGKTFTALRIAEDLAGAGKRVLFLVPSLSLLSQTLTEWTQESRVPLHSFAVCSDSDVGKKRRADDDLVQTFTHELRFPATTNARRLAEEMTRRHQDSHMSVVFSTYHSIDVLHRAQHQHDLADFDLVICDEAHRTTGATAAGEDESAFVRVHDSAFLRATKRLYMTATPRIYADSAKATAEQDDTALFSMDNPALYGENLFVITFSEAVKTGLLVDYKVLVLAMDENHVSRSLQNLLKDDDHQIKVEDAAKIIGCWKALSKQDTGDALGDDAAPMKRAVAFCQVIEMQQGGKTHKVSSKRIASMFARVVEEYKRTNPDLAERAITLDCQADHIDGAMTASEKEEKLAWLKADVPDNTCRILSNVRCLSEGVDVPALDAVLFLTPRNSQVDVVQSVGRVMRRADGKTRGYVVLPVVIPAGIEPHEALNNNQTYRVVWQVLQALRSHDDRFDAMINKMELIGADPTKIEVIAVTDRINRKKSLAAADATKSGRGTFTIGTPGKSKKTDPENSQYDIQFNIGEIERALYAKIVEKCGNRHHWEDWANDIARIAQTHISRITTILDTPDNHREREAFHAFAQELRDDLNDSITDTEIIEMLAQHLITRPVFDALFSDYSFASHNPMSRAMQAVLDILQEHRLEREADTLTRFYDSVKLRAEGIDKFEGKQKIIIELYDKFFRNAFPKMTEKLGIVYTPVEVVDFIIHSVNDLLQSEFGQTLGSPGVHILDPFTGTGTFITRLLQSGLIRPEDLPRKYASEIHANEIVLLAYYIAAINIEAAYHGIIGGDYKPFDGICLTDTFQMYEKDDLIDALLIDNSQRRKRQKKLDIRVIMGNPPYSVGDIGVTYDTLDGSIRRTYAARSTANNKNALYDSYIRAIRWASDRIGNAGIIAYVSNAGWVDANTADGLRQCLVEEFSSLYVFHLRGNQRTQGERSRKEGGKIFGSGSRTPVAITLLVKNPQARTHGEIRFHDIGDYLSREEKLSIIASLGSIAGISQAGGWQKITPDAHGDWLRQRDDIFGKFMVLGNKDDKSSTALFYNYSRGLETGRDAWAYNGSQAKLGANMGSMIDFYNAEVERLAAAYPGLNKKARQDLADDFIDTNPQRISWTSSLKADLAKGCSFAFKETCVVPSLYRPFSKQWVYYDTIAIHRLGQMPSIFPKIDGKNLAINVSSIDGVFSVLIANAVPSKFVGESVGQWFPLYLYDEEAQAGITPNMFAAAPQVTTRSPRRDAITDEGLRHFQAAYPGEALTKDDLFYYVYGLLHSPDYRERFADNLSKELPRIPCVRQAADFWAFVQAGRALADLHVGYETVPIYAGAVVDTGGKTLTSVQYRVEKMKFGGKGREKDRTTLIYNPHITVRNIPLAAYEYVVNGKPALEWVMERQCVKTDKDSGIVNDANDWAIETMKNPKYPLELFLRVITVSLETMKIVQSLPALDIDSGPVD